MKSVFRLSIVCTALFIANISHSQSLKEVDLFTLISADQCTSNCDSDIFKKVWMHLDDSTGMRTYVDTASVAPQPQGGFMVVIYSGQPRRMFDASKLTRMYFNCQGQYQDFSMFPSVLNDFGRFSIAGKIEQAFCFKSAPTPSSQSVSAKKSDADFNAQVQSQLQAAKARKSLVPASTNDQCISLIRVSAMADAYVRQCGQRTGISQAVMDHYSRSACARISTAEEINNTRKQVEFDSVSDFNREGAQAYCREAGEFYADKSAMYGLR